jgi:hypothetical protein
MKEKTLKFISLCFCLTLSVPLFGQGSEADNSASSCKAFVGQFYTWYLERISKEKSLRASDLALKYRPYLFSAELVRRIKEDSEAQVKAGSDLVSLDADPFGGPDGLGDRYVIERVTVNDGKCLAEVHAVWGGKEDESPDATPELKLNGGKWLFVNFYYPSPTSPDSQDLLSELRALKEMRKRSQAAKEKKHRTE